MEILSVLSVCGDSMFLSGYVTWP